MPSVIPPAPAAGAPPAVPAAPAAPAAVPGEKKTVAKDVRNRILGESPLEKKPSIFDDPVKPAPGTPGGAAAPAAVVEKKEDPPAAPAAPVPPVEKVKKVTPPAPPLPTAAAPAAPTKEDIEAAVRSVLPGVTTAKTSVIAPADERELELATFAASKDAKYADMPEKVTAWYDARDAHISEKAKEYGGQSTPEFRDYLESDDFKAFVREHRPNFQRGDRDRLHEEMLVDRGARRAREEMRPEFDEMKRRQAEIENEPMIKSKAAEAVGIMLADSADEKDPALEAFRADPVKFAENHPIEARLVGGEAKKYMDAVEEMLRVDRGIVPVAHEKRPIQKFLANFLQERNAEMVEKFPNGIVMQDGTIVIAAATLDRLQKEKVPGVEKYRTFNGDEVAGMLAREGQAVIKNRLKVHREEVGKSVYVKPKETPAAPLVDRVNEPEKSPLASVAATRSAPGGAEQKKEPYYRRYLN